MNCDTEQYKNNLFFSPPQFFNWGGPRLNLGAVSPEAFGEGGWGPRVRLFPHFSKSPTVDQWG
jgi:hypothetical protein